MGGGRVSMIDAVFVLLVYLLSAAFVFAVIAFLAMVLILAVGAVYDAIVSSVKG